jgi:RsiW-degrading membrane proteinase PrsW (M82 family)
MMLIGLIVLLVTPSIVFPGIAVGALAWRKWQLIPGSLVPPLTFWVFWRDTFRDDDAIQVVPVAFLLGLVWSLSAHAFRRKMTA